MPLKSFIRGKLNVQGRVDQSAGKQTNMKSASYTIGLADSGADYEITAAADQVAQDFDITAGIPAKARLVDAVIECTESFDTGTVDGQAGTTVGGVDIIASANCDAAGDLIAVAAASNFLLGLDAANRSVHIRLVRGVANWDTLTAGALKVRVSYIDHADS